MNIFKDRGTFGIIIGVLVAIAVAIFQSIGWDRVLPLLSVVVFALIILNIVISTEDRITQTIDNRLPKLSYLDERKEVELSTLELVENASEFIIATGGRSKNIEYLSAIEKKVQNEGVLYWRIIFNEKITRELFEHFKNIISQPNVTIAQIVDTSYGNMIITDRGMLMALPVPNNKELKAILVPKPDYSQKMYNEYMMTIFSKAKKINSLEETMSLCENKNNI